MNPEIVQKFKLHPYQQQIADFVLKTPRNGLFLPVGAGKTRIVLSVLEQLKPKAHILVIAPAPIARITWKEEIEETGADINYISFVTGPKGGKLSKKRRMELYSDVENQPPSLYTISRELVPDIVEYFQKKKIWPFPILIVDELQSFKSNSSSRFKAIKSIIKKTYRFTGLTGTPAPNGLMDLWSQIYLMDGGMRLGTTITKYRNTFFNEGMHINGCCVEWNPKPFMPALDAQKNPIHDVYGNIIPSGMSAKEMIYKIISDIVISIDISKYLNLPEKITAVHKIEMDEKEEALYRKMAKEQVIEIDKNGDVIAAENAAILSQKLTQMASGNLYINEQHDFVTIHEKKLDMLQYIIENEPTPILVAYFFQTDKQAILKRIPDAVPFSGEPEIKEKWDKKQIHVMLIHPASVGFGLNLQHGGHTLIWYTLSWSLEQYIQTIGRIHRQGQKHPTVIHYLITKGTIDERIMKVLENKDADQSKLLQAVLMETNDIRNG